MANSPSIRSPPASRTVQSGATSSPICSGSSRACPRAIMARTTGEPCWRRSRRMPRQSMTRAAGNSTRPPSPCRRSSAITPSLPGRADRNAPRITRSCPRAMALPIRSAEAGGTRWRWTSHQATAWRRKRARSSVDRPVHSRRTWGRIASMASRQLPPCASACRASWRAQRNRALTGAPSGTSATDRIRGTAGPCSRGSNPRRDRATISPRWPCASSDSAWSIMDSPVPMISTRPSGSVSGIASHAPVSSPEGSLSGRLCPVARIT